ncbi:unnamed protein product, partial [Mesorhabditis spiculigera]
MTSTSKRPHLSALSDRSCTGTDLHDHRPPTGPRKSHSGPIIDAKQRDHIHSLVNGSYRGRSKTGAGGTYEDLFYRPTVLADTPLTAPAFADEVFGPVAPVTSFATVEQAVAIANDSEYGLSLGILTSDAMRGLELAQQIPTGLVHINDQTGRRQKPSSRSAAWRLRVTAAMSAVSVQTSMPSRKHNGIFSCCSREGPVDEHSYDEQCREPQRYANCHRFPGPVRSKIAAPGGRDHRRFEPGSDDRLDDADAAGSDPGTDSVRPRSLSSAGVSWVTTATLLSAAVFTPLLGRYGDQHGKKRTLVGVLVVMVIADPRPCTPGNSHRDLPSHSSVLREEIRPQKLPGAMALVSGTLAFGSGLALVATGLLTSAPDADYRNAFWMATGFAVLALTLPSPRWSRPPRTKAVGAWTSSVR